MILIKTTIILQLLIEANVMYNKNDDSIACSNVTSTYRVPVALCLGQGAGNE